MGLDKKNKQTILAKKSVEALQNVQIRTKRRKKLSIVDMIGYSKFVGKDNLLELRDPKDAANPEVIGYMDMITIIGKDLNFLDDSNGSEDIDIIRGFYELLSSYVDDWDSIVSQMPADTSIQQAAWATNLDAISKEMGETTDSQRYQQLQARYQLTLNEMEMDKVIVDKVTHQTYVAFIYGNTKGETRRLVKEFKALGGNSVVTEKMPLIRKEMMLKLFNNPKRGY